MRFVLDTGSGMSVISEQTAKRLGIKPIARGGLARAVGGGGKFEIVYGFLDSIEIGTREDRKRSRLYSKVLRQPYSGGWLSGVIGGREVS